MKLIFSVLVAALSSASAFACPNLSGTFVCPGNQNSPAETAVLTQAITNGATVYTMIASVNGAVVKTSSFIADGVARMQPDGPNGTDIPESYTCEGDSSVRMDSTFDANGSQATTLQYMGLDAQNNMVVTLDMTISGQTQHLERNCARQ